MHAWSVGKIVKRLVVVAVLFFVLFFLVDLLYLSLSPLGRSPEDFYDEFPLEDVWYDIRYGREKEPEPTYEYTSYWQDSLAQGSLLTRTVAISATATTLSFDFDLWIPTDHPVATNVTQGGVGAKFAEAAFGEVWLNIGSLREDEYSSPTWSLSPETQSLHVRFHASRSIGDYLARMIEIELSRAIPSTEPDHDEVVVKLSDQRLISFQPQPDGATHNEVYLRRTFPESIDGFGLRIEPTTVVESKSPSPAPERESRQGFLLRLGRLFDVVWLSSILYGLVEALPLLIFWVVVWQRNVEAPPFAVSLAGAVASLLLFHFTLYFLGAVQGLTIPCSAP